MGAMTTNRLVLTNANVIDCVGERPIVGGSVVIERGQIAEVLDGSRPPDTRNADVIDLEGTYLLPGLWDVHIHPDYLAATGASAVDQTIAFGHRLMEALTGGGGVRAPLTSWTWPGSERSTRASMSARACSPPVTSSRPPAAISSRRATRSNATARTDSSAQSGSRSRTASITSSST